MQRHFITKCRQCSMIISECRCPSPNKTILFGSCSDCSEKDNAPIADANAAKEDAKEIEPET